MVFRHSADRVPAHRGASGPGLVRDLGRHLRVSSRTSRTTTACSRSRDRGRGWRSPRSAGRPTASPTSSHAPAKIGSAPSPVAHRLHRRPRLRDHRPGRQRGRRARRRPRRRPHHGMRPFGEEALMMLRIEAGLPLIDVEWHNSRLAFTDARPGHAQGARAGLDAARRPRGRPGVRRPRRHPARARERARHAGRRSASSSTGRTGTGSTASAGLLPPKDAHPLAYESMLHDPDHGGGPRSATPPLHVLPRPAAPHRVGPGPARPRRAGHRGAHRADAQPPTRTVARPHGEAAPVQPPEEDGQGHDGPPTARPAGAVRRHRGRRRPQRPGQRRPTSPRRACARWSSRSATWSAVRRSPRSSSPGSRSRPSPTR